MGRFLDQRSSENSSGTGAGAAVAITFTPALFGVVGLQTQGVANPIVNLTGTVGLSALGVATVLIQVQRGSTVFGSGPIIYTAVLSPVVAVAGDVRSFSAQDLLAPAAAETVYAAFISSVSNGGAISTVTRVGPEVFWGLASATV
jgi:hypothetical protein